MRFSIIILLILAFMINPAFAAELPSKTLSGHADRVFAISFSPGGRTIATASADNTIRIWDVESGEVLKILEGHEGDVTAVVFSNRLWASTGGRRWRLFGVPVCLPSVLCYQRLWEPGERIYNVECQIRHLFYPRRRV